MKPPAKDGNAGQVVCQPVVKEQFHRPLYTPTRNPENMPKTLADVVKQIEESEQKLLKKKNLTFDEWMDENEEKFNSCAAFEEYTGTFYELMELSWNAAQENV